MRTLILIVVIFTLSTPIALGGDFKALLTVYVKDAQGLDLKFDAEKPLVKLGNYTCTGSQCRFNITLLNYEETSLPINLSVFWLNMPVYQREYILENGTTYSFTVKTNASRVNISGVNDRNKKLEKCRLTLKPYGVTKTYTVLCGNEISLPFGTYSVENAEVQLATSFVRVQTAVSGFTVVNGTKSVQVPLNVADSITLRLLKSDGSLMTDCHLTLLFDPSNYNVTVYNGRVQGGIIPLYNLPYGTYLADVTWYGINVLKTVFTIGGKYSTINLTSSLLAQVRLQILDTDSKPLQFIKVKITGMGINEEVTTNAAGYAFLTDVPPGTYYVTVKCVGGEASSFARITTGESWAVIPSRRLNLTIVSEYAGGLMTPNLPPGLWASISYNDSLLSYSENTEEKLQLTLNLDKPVCVQTSLKLKIGWNECILIEKTIEPYSSQLVEKVPFLDLEIKVTDRRGDPLAGALVEVNDELGLRTLKTNEYGIVYAYHVYGKHFKVEVKWEGVSVASQNVRAPTYSLELNADVWKLQVDVRNAIGNPVSGALIVFLVEGENFSYTVNATTRDNGIVEIALPVPSSSHVEMSVVKGRVHANYVVTNKDLKTGIIQVSTDLILDYGPLQLRVGEVVIAALIGIPMLLAVVVVFKYVTKRRTAESVFTVYGRELKSEEEESKNLMEALRDRFKTIFSAEEEEGEGEEEEDVFEEL